MSGGDDVKKSDLTIEILKDIRQELRDMGGRIDKTNARLDEMNGRLDATNVHLDETNARLDGLARRVVESEIRTATALTDLAHNVHELTSYLRAQGDLRPRVERCEREIAEIQTKLRPASAGG